jgi:hypothetical protein
MIKKPLAIEPKASETFLICTKKQIRDEIIKLNKFQRYFAKWKIVLADKSFNVKTSKSVKTLIRCN